MCPGPRRDPRDRFFCDARHLCGSAGRAREADRPPGRPGWKVLPCNFVELTRGGSVAQVTIEPYTSPAVERLRQARARRQTSPYMARMNPELAQPEEPAPPSRTLSLRTREILAVTILTLCVIVLTTVMHLYHTQRIVLNATRSQAEFVARQIYFQSAHALSRQPGHDPRAVLARDAELRALLEASVGYDPSLLYALIADEQGVAIVHTDRRREGERLPPQPGFRDAFPARSGLALSAASQVYEVALPFDVGGKPFAAIRLGIAVPLIRSQLNDVLWQTLALGAIALAAALLVALALSTVTLQPIR